MDIPHFIAVPLDARPVCYDQLQDLARIGHIGLSMPPADMLGQLKQPANFDRLSTWWQETLAKYPASPAIMALDTLAYGGLIAGRVNLEPMEVLEQRVQSFLKALKPSNKPRYGFTSILRIPNYDNSEEEPDYWATYGRMLYQFSVETHKKGTMPDHMFNQIPGTVITDFLKRREKNFFLNKSFLSLVEKKTLDFLTFCQDDTGPYGMNVMEAERLQTLIKKMRESYKSHVQTGADEVALLMMAKALWSKETQPLKIFCRFLPEVGKKVVAKFDGLPIGDVVQRQMKTLGALNCLTPDDADMILLVYSPSSQMGDHMSGETPVRDPEQLNQGVELMREWLPTGKLAVADVLSANGADSQWMLTCANAGLPLGDLLGYAAWNTPGNTIGTALAMGAVSTWAKRHGCLNDEARKTLVMKRLLDDWVYQSEIRFKLRQGQTEVPSESVLQEAMQPSVTRLASLMGLAHLSPTFSFPCQRFFEIRVSV